MPLPNSLLNTRWRNRQKCQFDWNDDSWSRLIGWTLGFVFIFRDFIDRRLCSLLGNFRGACKNFRGIHTIELSDVKFHCSWYYLYAPLYFKANLFLSVPCCPTILISTRLLLEVYTCLSLLLPPQIVTGVISVAWWKKHELLKNQATSSYKLNGFFSVIFELCFNFCFLSRKDHSATSHRFMLPNIWPNARRRCRQSINVEVQI